MCLLRLTAWRPSPAASQQAHSGIRQCVVSLNELQDCSHPLMLHLRRCSITRLHSLGPKRWYTPLPSAYDATRLSFTSSLLSLPFGGTFPFGGPFDPSGGPFFPVPAGASPSCTGTPDILWQPLQEGVAGALQTYGATRCSCLSWVYACDVYDLLVKPSCLQNGHPTVSITVWRGNAGRQSQRRLSRHGMKSERSALPSHPALTQPNDCTGRTRFALASLSGSLRFSFLNG